MLIPGLVEDLHKPRPPFDQSAGQKAGRSISSLARCGPIEIQDVLRFLTNIHQLRSTRLHLVGHLEGIDARGNLRIAHPTQTLTVEFLNGIQRLPLGRAVHTLRIGQVENRITAAAEKNPIVDAGQETRPPVGGPSTRPLAAGRKYHVSRKITALTAQTVSRPSPQTGATKLLRTRVHEDLRRGMIEGVRVHRSHDGDIIGHLGQMRHELGNLLTRLAVSSKAKLGPQQFGVRTNEGRPIPLEQFSRGKFSIPLRQLRLVVEELQMAWGSGLE